MLSVSVFHPFTALSRTAIADWGQLSCPGHALSRIQIDSMHLTGFLNEKGRSGETGEQYAAASVPLDIQV